MAQQLDHSISIQTALQNIDSNKVDEDKLDLHLDVLEQYECWQPLFRLILARLKSEKTRTLQDYLRLARIYSLYLEDIPRLAETCRDLVKANKLPYQKFRDEVLTSIILEEDFSKESQILEEVNKVLTNKNEKVACTERLCLIYEKKKYDEEGLSKSYEALIKLDSHNQKALRYFKAVYTQNHAWEDVVHVLKKLYEGAKHVNDGYRIAQELATVYLFQMDLPEEAIAVLERYCKGSPLDTSSIKYESYYRMKNWKGCLEVLLKFLPKVDSGTNKSIIYLKIGELQELIGNQEEALESYDISFRAQQNILEPLENMIEIYVHNQDWTKVVECLNKMMKTVSQPLLIERISEAISRIEGGMSGSSV